MPPFKEALDAGNAQRAQSLEQLSALLEERRREADVQRTGFFAPRTDSAAHYADDTAYLRQEFAAMLGWPLAPPPPAPLRPVQETFVGEDDTCRIFRLRIPSLGPLDIYGLLFVPHGKGPFPVIIAQHGGQGTPEMVSDLSADSGNYHAMARRPVARGAIVFAPQLFLSWQKEWGPGHEQLESDRDLKQLGGSRAALEILLLRRALDYLLTRPDVDEKRAGIIGLSYGGFYALACAALDTRFCVCLSSCWFNDRYRYNFGDWVWTGSALRFLDAEMASLVCPRPLYIEVGADDEAFGSEGVPAELEKVQSRYRALHVSPLLGFKKHEHGHAFDPSDAGLDFVFSHLEASS